MTTADRVGWEAEAFIFIRAKMLLCILRSLHEDSILGHLDDFTSAHLKKTPSLQMLWRTDGDTGGTLGSSSVY